MLKSLMKHKILANALLVLAIFLTSCSGSLEYDIKIIDEDGGVYSTDTTSVLYQCTDFEQSKRLVCLYAKELQAVYNYCPDRDRKPEVSIKIIMEDGTVQDTETMHELFHCTDFPQAKKLTCLYAKELTAIKRACPSKRQKKKAKKLRRRVERRK